MDQMGNIHGRTDGMNASAAALLFGSHLVMPSTNFFCLITQFWAYKGKKGHIDWGMVLKIT